MKMFKIVTKNINVITTIIMVFMIMTKCARCSVKEATEVLNEYGFFNDDLCKECYDCVRKRVEKLR